MVSLAMKAPEASAAIVVRSKRRASPWLLMRKPPLSMISAVVASLFSSNSRSSSSSSWISSSISWGSVAMSCVLRSSLADILIKQHPGDHIERLKNAFAAVRSRAEGGHLHFAVVEQKFHVFGRRNIGKVPFVVLQDVGNLSQIQLEGLQIVFQVREGLDVLRHFLVLRIGDKHDAIHATKNKLAGRVVNDLARDSIKLELCFEALDGH